MYGDEQKSKLKITMFIFNLDKSIFYSIFDFNYWLALC